MVKIGILGASGETGKAIVEGLLEAGGFEIVSLARPTSLSSNANQKLAAQGVEIRALDLKGDHSALVAALKDLPILISAIAGFSQLDQIPLATAAKEAGVKRFFPCAFVSVMPPGIHDIRDAKEQVYNHVKRLGLSYTIVDCGWWYQNSISKLPSGRTDYVIHIPDAKIPGDGNVPSALIDLRDVGKYMAKIVVDGRTIDKYVLIYNELLTANQEVDLLEKLSGEKVERQYVPGEALEFAIADAGPKLEKDPMNFSLLLQRIGSQYLHSMGVRGDNTPEYAKYLGYVTSKELYPDVEFIKLETYLKEVLKGKAKPVYEDGALAEFFKQARTQPNPDWTSGGAK